MIDLLAQGLSPHPPGDGHCATAPFCHSATNPDHCLMVFLPSWTSKRLLWPDYSTVNVLAIHSNIEHRNFDTDKSGSGLRESIASRNWLVENEWNPSVPSCLREPVYKQSWLFMRIVVTRKSGINQKRAKQFKRSIQMTCVVLLNTAFFFFQGYFPSSFKVWKNMSHSPMSRNIQKVHF